MVFNKKERFPGNYQKKNEIFQNNIPLKSSDGSREFISEDISDKNIYRENKFGGAITGKKEL